MSPPPAAVPAFAGLLADLGWVTDLMVAGSLATGDWIPGVSDLDLVALTDGPAGPDRQAVLAALHRTLDAGIADGLNLGCVYVDAARAAESDLRHPTWTHGRMVQRILSGVTRAELVRHGYPVLGRPPAAVFAPMTDDDVRAAARAELTGYWAWAARRPWLWLDPVIADLGLTSMARGRHTLATGELLSKSVAIERAHAPRWLIDQLRVRRNGAPIPSPRLPTALIAWWDARRTVDLARRGIIAS
ncbi:nucleotidyltransferase domain-containing protein [Actinoplanes rectilineatus]|uniref:nucleotidyltransferase domain-containing protein n=1 Tax=Actinoplanes rectilineatus TaxID=113571 RepID=UPI0005F2D84F|nr:nucleotidyltransferase domain-containing protein [Actinoplanes rectilineatus]